MAPQRAIYFSGEQNGGEEGGSCHEKAEQGRRRQQAGAFVQQEQG